MNISEPPARALLAVAFVAGAAVMVAELAATRLVAPWFGTATPVWAALISFVLAGLALGAWAGGHAASRVRPEVIFDLLGGAAALLAAVPFASRGLLGPATAALLAGRPAEALALVLVLGALALPAVAALGAAGPLLLEVSIREAELERAGALAGALSAASTVGSIAGTLLAAFAGLPLLGTTRCLAAAALLLGLTAGACVDWRRRLLFAAAPAAALALSPLALPRHPLALDTRESAYGLVQTLERGGARELIVDQDFALQSSYRPGQPVRQEPFAHAAVALAAARPRPGDRPRALLLGLGAGTAARALRQCFADAELTGFELDPEVLRQARLYFDLPTLEAHVGDARALLAADPRRFDLIFVDAFRFPYVPFHLATAEFAALLAAHLRPGGVVLFNVGRWDGEQQVVSALGATLLRAFPVVLAVDAANRSNTLLYAGDAGLQAALAAAPGRLPLHLRELSSRVAGSLRAVAPGPALTDDLAPVEQLTDGILLRALWRGWGRL